ncbi:MAG TPA: hypothetical protein PLP19_04500 [bacterium]|nr:hypothetical protein [bacterium]HPN42731.1 hypothetical protein [bacterium]
MPSRKQFLKAISIISMLIVFSGTCTKKDYILNESDKFVVEDIPEEIILALPTPDKSGQCVHPDIQYFEEGFNKNKFFLVYTPYPFSKNSYENPCLAVSNNGVDYDEFTISQNPLARTPKNGYNNDPELYFDKEKKEFYLFYLETVKPDYQNLIRLKSSDCIKWERSLVNHFVFPQDIFIVSPSIVKRDSIFYLFFVNLSRYHYPIQFVKNIDSNNMNFEDRTTINTEFPEGFIPWHIDVFPAGNKFVMLACGPFSDSKLYLAVSSDLVNWTFNCNPLLINTTGFYNSKKIYRSTGLVFNNILVVWFSLQTIGNEWMIGVKKFPLKNVLPSGVTIK